MIHAIRTPNRVSQSGHSAPSAGSSATPRQAEIPSRKIGDIDRARTALDRYARTGDVTIEPAYKDGDDRAGMFFPLDYYGRSDRGAIAAWKNQMAVMT